MLSTRVATSQRRASLTRSATGALFVGLFACVSVATPLTAQTIPDGTLVIPLKPGNRILSELSRMTYDGARLELLFDAATNGDIYVIVRDLVSLPNLAQGVPPASLEIQIDDRPAVRVNLAVIGRGESSRNTKNVTVFDAYRGQLSDDDAAALLVASRVRGRVRGLSFESDPKAAKPLLANATRRRRVDVMVGPSGPGQDTRAGGGRPQGGGAGPDLPGNPGSPHGANIRIVRDFAFEAPDSVSSKFTAVAESVSNPVAGPACGASRLCASGWDLRPVAINLPARTLPAGGVVPVTIVVENRGAMASQLSELQVCFQSTSSRASCSTRIANVNIPPIPSAASVRVSVTARIPTGEASDFYLGAIVDPDQFTSEVNRDNNFLASDALASERPALQWLQVEAAVLGEERKMVQLTMRIRNKSVAASSDPTEVAVRTHDNCGTDGSSPYRFQVPALGPRQTVRVQLVVSHPIRAVCDTTPRMNLRVDPDEKLLWGGAHEGGFTLTYEAPRR